MLTSLAKAGRRNLEIFGVRIVFLRATGGQPLARLLYSRLVPKTTPRTVDFATPGWYPAWVEADTSPGKSQRIAVPVGVMWRGSDGVKRSKRRPKLSTSTLKGGLLHMKTYPEVGRVEWGVPAILLKPQE